MFTFQINSVAPLKSFFRVCPRINKHKIHTTVTNFGPNMILFIFFVCSRRRLMLLLFGSIALRAKRLSSACLLFHFTTFFFCAMQFLPLFRARSSFIHKKHYNICLKYVWCICLSRQFNFFPLLR